MEMTYLEVKKKLANNYDRQWGGVNSFDRELNIYKGNNSVILTLEGSPPKGFCYAADGRISFYDTKGKRFKYIYGWLIEKEGMGEQIFLTPEERELRIILKD